jgi:hypothetical protein
VLSHVMCGGDGQVAGIYAGGARWGSRRRCAGDNTTTAAHSTSKRTHALGTQVVWLDKPLSEPQEEEAEALMELLLHMH